MAESWNDTLLKAQQMIDADEAGNITTDVRQAFEMLSNVGNQQYEATGETPESITMDGSTDTSNCIPPTVLFGFDNITDTTISSG